MKKKNYILLACLAITVYSSNAAEERQQPAARAQHASELATPLQNKNFALQLHHVVAGSQLTVTISHAATESHTQNVQTEAPSTREQSTE